MATTVVGPTTKPNPIYVSDLSVGFSGRATDPVVLSGTAPKTIEPLSVSVEIAGGMATAKVPPHSNAFPIGTIPKKMARERIEFVLLHPGTDANGTTILLWGDSTISMPAKSPLPNQIFHVRVNFSGAQGEQHYYFEIAWPAAESPFVIIPAQMG
jgi:hypothetical protein